MSETPFDTGMTEQSIRVCCFHSLEEAAFLRSSVNALNLASAKPDPFSTFEFYENYVRHREFGREERLWFLAAFVSDRLFGYLALKRVAQRTLGLRSFKLEFLVSDGIDRRRVVSRPDDLSLVTESFYNFLIEQKSEWSLFDLGWQDRNSSLFPPPRTVNLQGYLVHSRPAPGNNTIFIQWSTLDEYFKALSRGARSNVSRQIRNLFAAGKLEFIGSSDPATTPALLELYLKIEQFSWKRRSPRIIGASPQMVGYFRGLLDAQQPMRVSIHILLLEKLPIAGIILGGFERTIYALQVVFDERLSRLSPGSAVWLLAVRHAINARYASFDLMLGHEYYKTRWLAEVTERRSVQIYRARDLSCFWKRVCGDLRYRLLALAKRDLWLSNPKRRASKIWASPLWLPRQTCKSLQRRALRLKEIVLFHSRERAVSPPSTIRQKHLAKLRMPPEVQQRIAMLTTQLREGEYLSSVDLATTLPFATERPRPQPVKRRR